MRFLPGVRLEPESSPPRSCRGEQVRIHRDGGASAHFRSVAARMREFVAGRTPGGELLEGHRARELRADARGNARRSRDAPGVLSGPSFAREIANDLPCGVALACADGALAGRLAREIANPFLSIRAAISWVRRSAA
jgi:glycerol-3-phosphate dehydrogenase